MIDSYCFSIEIPIHAISEANSREHWSEKKRRHSIQKKWIFSTLPAYRHLIKTPCTVVMTRIGKRKMDFDNLVSSLKYVRDAIADFIFPGLPPGRADDHPLLFWEYRQKIDKKYSVQIDFIVEGKF